ncbi:MAG: transcriptional regulator [Gammaproteobacteria bacterium]|nr:transcriptional regulator [Gammaproteobacteria bacterium]
MSGYAQFCPIAKATEVLGQRWMLLVLRELLCGSRQFNDIHRGVPKMSRALLVKRLRELEAEGMVARSEGSGGHLEYHLTAAGEALRPIVMSLGEWGKRWVGTGIAPQDLDASLVMWDVQRRIARDALPDHKVVIKFRFVDAPRRDQQFWLMLEPEDVDLCLKDPGYEVDLIATSDVATFTKIWLGDLGFRQAVQDGDFRLTGPRELRRSFPDWLRLSPFATIPRARSS